MGCRCRDTPTSVLRPPHRVRRRNRLLLVAVVIGLFGVARSDDVRAKPKKDDCLYQVVAGDTLGGIASRHSVSEKALISANPELKKNPDFLRLGQTLDLCAAKAKQSSASTTPSSPSKTTGKRCGKRGRLVEHKVSSGETLSGIAGDHGVTEASIRQRNQALRDKPDLLQIGQQLEICVEPASVRKDKACNYESAVHRHEVVPGEHLGQIAGRYGVRRHDLIRLNSRLRSNPDSLRVGETIRVCPLIAPRERTKIQYSVQSGDTLGSIAVEYGLTPNELLRFQQGKLSDPNSLRVGQSLVVWVDGGVLRGFAEQNDDKGVLKGGIQLPPGPHYVVKWKAAAWGTSRTIRAIQSAIAAYQRRTPGGPKVHVGDISKRNGGKFPPHISHQHGRDVDVGYVLDGKYAHETRFRSANARNFNVRRNWALLKAFIDTDEVQYIFMDYRLQKLVYEYAKEAGVGEDTLDELFQYPRGRGRSHGIVRHWRGHVNHFHVRFRK